MLNATEKIAVRFNFQKMAPLGIADSDYRRVAMALDLNEGEVRAYCAQLAAQVEAAAAEIRGSLPEPARGARICFIGDSLTSERGSYLRIAQHCFAGCPNVEILDCAVSGWKTSDVIFEYEGRVPEFRPDIIHMMLGTNDARNAYPGEDGSTAGVDGYRRNMSRLIRYGLALGARVIVTTIPPTKAAAALPDGRIPVWETRRFNAELRALAGEYPIVLNDMEAALEGALEQVIDDFDNVHLNAGGQRMTAQALLPLLVREINRF